MRQIWPHAFSLHRNYIPRRRREDEKRIGHHVSFVYLKEDAALAGHSADGPWLVAPPLLSQLVSRPPCPVCFPGAGWGCRRLRPPVKGEKQSVQIFKEPLAVKRLPAAIGPPAGQVDGKQIQQLTFIRPLASSQQHWNIHLQHIPSLMPFSRPKGIAIERIKKVKPLVPLHSSATAWQLWSSARLWCHTSQPHRQPSERIVWWCCDTCRRGRRGRG